MRKSLQWRCWYFFRIGKGVRLLKYVIKVVITSVVGTAIAVQQFRPFLLEMLLIQLHVHLIVCLLIHIKAQSNVAVPHRLVCSSMEQIPPSYPKARFFKLTKQHQSISLSISSQYVEISVSHPFLMVLIL